MEQQKSMVRNFSQNGAHAKPHNRESNNQTGARNEKYHISHSGVMKSLY